MDANAHRYALRGKKDKKKRERTKERERQKK